MPGRTPISIWGTYYGAATLFGALAVLALLKAVPIAIIWPLSIGALVFAGLGLGAQVSSNRLTGELLQERAASDLLRADIQDRSQVVDSFADGLDVAIFICDAKGVVVFANGPARSMFRFEEPIGRSILAITLSYDLERLVLETADTGQIGSREVVVPPPDDRVAIAKAWPGPETSNPESPQRIFLSIYEVTNLRRLERMRQDFVANVSHELRTPMSVIRAYAETLLDETTPDPQTLGRYLPRIIEEVDRLSGITQDLLILSAAESERVQKHACDIAEIYQTVVGQLSKKAQDKGLEVEYQGPDAFIIEANPTQMSQVAVNLIDNAINYTSKGRVDVFLDPVVDAGGRHTVEIRVLDTGIGIASEHAPRVFERFYRVDKGRSRSTGGTGLGLSIVKHIVEAHDGTVSLRSALNEGSEFRVGLPVGTVEREAVT